MELCQLCRLCHSKQKTLLLQRRGDISASVYKHKMQRKWIAAEGAEKPSWGACGHTRTVGVRKADARTFVCFERGRWEARWRQNTQGKISAPAQEDTAELFPLDNAVLLKLVGVGSHSVV